MNIGIVTIYDPNPNFGNRLQNYAVQTVLEHLGYDSVTYSFEKDYFNSIALAKYFAQLVTGFKLPGNKEYWKNVPPRIFKFRKFNKKYINTKSIKKIEDIVNHNCDYYVVGSDQVWNVNWYGNSELRKNMYMLTFATPEQRVCFAPSFGIEELPEEWKIWFKKNLSTFRAISVREEAGAKIIKDLIGVDVSVLVDPTMMLTKEEWRKISKKPKNVKEGYVLTYFLSPKCKEAERELNNLKDQYLIYEILNSKDNLLKNIGPSEFLWLFDHAKLILTDSFHACVFSFIFNKPFKVYDRNWKESNTNSRIETLLSKFGIERKYVHSGMDNDIWEHDYLEGYKVLQIERNKTIAYLDKSLKEKCCG